MGNGGVFINLRHHNRHILWQNHDKTKHKPFFPIAKM